ncbi:hypothetical protein EJB05_43417, partial [Eragrostis curvula]
MRRAGVLLALLLLYLSALSASTAEAHKETLSDSAAFLSGRKWYGVPKIVAAPYEDSKEVEVTEQEGTKTKDAKTVHSNGGERTVEVSSVVPGSKF